MLLLKLSEEQMTRFDQEPEAAMGVHFAQSGERIAVILSGRVLMFLSAEPDENSTRLVEQLWSGRQDYERSLEDELLNGLASAPADISYVRPVHPWLMGFILNPIGYLPPARPRPAYIYGHLPFDGRTQQNDVYYRCEHWLVSRRVLIGTGEVLAGTYGFPESEFAFVPTGFAAVGRYALPDLPPACRRYEICPPDKYLLKCGAAVPLYGQAGGGVEVMFPTKFTNRIKPIPAPTILHPL
jgi:hypothetical protein